MASLWPSLVLIIGIIASAAASSPFYTVIAPKLIRPNSEYHVAISTTGISEPATIYIELNATLDSGDKYNVSQTAIVEPDTTRVVKFEIGDTTPGKYKLVAKGLSGILFENSTDIRYAQKSHSVFVQTDRAIYKPGNKVQFRTVVLDSKLRPAPSGTELDIYITDGQGNRVKQWKPQMDSRGVFSGELQLPDVPVLGNWKIFVKAFDQTYEKEFEVAEYVLPKFEVFVEVPKYATFKDSAITAVVKAKYTYGKPVKGVATITASTDSFAGYYRPMFPASVRRVVPIEGKASANFDLVRDLRIVDDYYQPVKLEVSVEEELTGRSQNASIEIKLHKQKYTMELVKTADSYKPGLKYTAFIKVAYHDGSPVQDTNNPVQISYGFGYELSSYTNFMKKLDEHGMIQLDIYSPPVSNDTSGEQLNIEAQYLNLHQWFGGTSRALSPSGTYIQAVSRTENPTANKEIEIEVNSTAPLKYLSYEVLSRGDIVAADSIRVADANTVTLRFLATHAMAPTAHVVVYYMRDDGEIVADALDIHLKGSLENFVDVETTPQRAKPGENVDLVITSKPNSYVGLLGVDQSSILLKSGNDISHKQVMDEIESYDKDDEYPWMYASSSRYWNPGSSSASEVFRETGTVVLTNGFLYERYHYVYPHLAFQSVAFASASVDRLPGVPAPAAAISPVKGGAKIEKEIKVRKNFPETWIWEMIDAGSEGRTVLKKSVPDTITSWVISAFSIDSVHGFGLLEEPRRLAVFQPFFVSLNLPYSVIRGETVSISILVFNYLDKDVTADVMLENEGQFEFAEATNEIQETPKLEPSRSKSVEVKARSGSSVSFLITPKELGYINIKAVATSALAGDSVEEKLRVKAEGETQYGNKAIFVDLRNTNSFETSIVVDIPEKAVPGSENIEVSAVGDILGPSLPNLANLIKMPYGCGEQNMLNFVPNIVVINYLKSTNQLTPTIHGKALKFLEVGYQQELTYRHDDGSFSAFGKSDKNGSTWLTAFVAKSFIQAAEHINIEDRMVKDALKWLASHQSPDGHFPEVGTVSHKPMQGGAAKGLALTAFTLIAFLQNETYAAEHNATVSKGLDYIVRNLEGLDDAYSLSICAYVLNLAKHPSEDTAFGLMQSKATEKEEQKWWGKPVPQDDKNPWYSMPSSVNVEMTSYAMLSYLRKNMVAEALPIMKWLVSQRNGDGGFASTQDTVIGIYALSKLGEKLSSENTNIGISFTYQDEGESSLNVTKENNVILQKNVIPKNTREVHVTASGTGFAIVQVSYSYNLNASGAFPLFTLNPQVEKNSDANHLELKICSGFVPTEEATESNMAVMEVNFPSGFVFDAETLSDLKASPGVKRVETKNGDTMVALYFDKMVREEYCPTVHAYRAHKVAKQKPVPVSIYDYYDSSRRARVFYEPLPATLCDICEGEHCGRTCAVDTVEAVQAEAPAGTATATSDSS